MKNAFLISLVCTLLAVMACKKDIKQPTEAEIQEELTDTTSVVEEIIEEKKATKKKQKKKTIKKKPTKKTITVPSDAPTFSTTAARKYIRDYEAYISNYKKAVESKADIESFLKLSEASSDLTKQYRTLISTLSGEEIEKMSTYMKAKTKQIEALSKQL